MIEFKNGEYIRREFLDIVEYEEINEDWWDYPLLEDCFILNINKNKDSITYFKIYFLEIEYVPRKEDTENEFWELFWDSELTLIFPCECDGIEYMKKNTGLFAKEFNEFAKLLLKYYETAIIYEQGYEYIIENNKF